MCGIAGIVGAGAGNREQALASIQIMTRAQHHRGPDDEGFWAQPGIALGHARLSILDLSPRGRQPMTSRDGRYTVVFNGEIFNYQDLRFRLESESGPGRQTATDTEVLLEACAKWGLEQTVSQLAGMFAFALWDQLRAEITLVRDRFGEKPLVYAWDGQTLAFASELKALSQWHTHRLDPDGVDAYLALGYVPAPLAIFRNCHKVEPGTWVRWKLPTPGESTRPLEYVRWWSGHTPSGQAPNALAQNARTGQRKQELRSLLGQAVQQRLHADVPVALSLSGGVDSSVIAVECAHSGSKPEAFTVCFDADQNDLPFAQAVAKHLGLRHEVFRLDLSGIEQRFENFVCHYDEPFADSSGFGALALAEALGGRRKVLLTGDGGDETFAGYRHYEYVGVKQMLKRAAAAAGWVDGNRPGENLALQVYVQSKTIFSRQDRSWFLPQKNPGHAFDRLNTTRAFEEPAGSALQLALWSDRHLALANGLTHKMDMALGAWGIEGRAPFLDHRLVDWAQTLAPDDLVRGRQKKILLRETYREFLPSSVLDRKKHGFGAPVDVWLKGPLKKMVAELGQVPLLAAAPVGRMNAQKRWALAVFSQWARKWNASW